MAQCPKCLYVRQSIDTQIHPDICPACGIVYKKWLNRHNTSTPSAAVNKSSLCNVVKEHVFYVPDHIDASAFWARVVTLVSFTLWGLYFVTAGVDWEKIGGSFLHNANLPFHEFGHIFFAPFGRFMAILGGSLFQVLMPLGLMLVFILKQRDSFAASIMLWWSGQNLIDISPYIDDAQYRILPLIGGGGEESHDWGNLLTMMDALESTHTIARMSFTGGVMLMAIAIAWSIYILRLQKKMLR